MRLIFDSGSTCTAFAVMTEGQEPEFHRLPHGHNAASAPAGTLSSMLSASGVIAAIAPQVKDVDYYGAGCAGPTICHRVKQELASVFPNAGVSVESDMLCAARALFGNRQGIACILGTGANSCLWDGDRIVDNVSPLGFILGDEGSGAVLGRLFIGLLFKGQFPRDVYERFNMKYHLGTAEIIEQVYRKERPGAFLASFAPFILEEASRTPEVSRFVTDEFRRFLRCNVMRYEGANALPIGFVGSIAWHFRTYLTNALEIEGLEAGPVIQDPLPALAHSLNKVV